MNIHHSTYKHLYNHNEIVLPSSYTQTEVGSVVVVAVAVVDFLDFRFCFFIVMRDFFLMLQDLRLVVRK